jgi:nicotinamidase-related amidase
MELLDRSRSVLVVVDIQERLLPAIHGREGIIPNVKLLAFGARTMQVPVIVTEQYPKGLGPTVSELKEALGAAQPLSKVEFSCASGPGFLEKLAGMGRKQVVLCGIESHVCMAQTTVELLGHGYKVWLVTDAMGSRRERDHESALRRLETGGAVLTTAEAVVFEWLRKAGTEEFKAVVGMVKGIA